MSQPDCTHVTVGTLATFITGVYFPSPLGLVQGLAAISCFVFQPDSGSGSFPQHRLLPVHGDFHGL